MAVFDSISLLLELKNVPFKERGKLQSSVRENGGHITHAINRQCNLVVTNDVSKLLSRLHRIQKFQIPVVALDYVHSCVETGVLLPVDNFKLDISSPGASSEAVSAPAAPLKTPAVKVPPPEKSERSKPAPEKVQGSVLDQFKVYKETDQHLPDFSDLYHVAKYSIFQTGSSDTWYVLELQSCRGDDGQKFRLVRYVLEKRQSRRDMLVFPETSEEAVEVYKAMMEMLKASDVKTGKDVPAEITSLCSSPLQQLLLEEKLSTGVLSHSVGVFVELLWTEAHGCLNNTLQDPIDRVSIDDVSRVEGLLIQAQREWKKSNLHEAILLQLAADSLLPIETIPRDTQSSVSKKLDLCQVIRDVLNLREMTMSSSVQSCLGKYRALRCNIEEVPKNSSEFQNVDSLLEQSWNNMLDGNVNIHQILRVTRGVELQTFKSNLGNIKPLFHSSSASSFVGILSRGLLLPRVGVEDHGITRTDAGKLGGGIYFTDSMRTCVGYSKPSSTDGSRLMLVCDVALGACKDVYRVDESLTQAPEGYASVHAVPKEKSLASEFTHDEFVVYSPDQVRLKYVVRFSLSTDYVKKFSPVFDLSDEPALPSAGDSTVSEGDAGISDVKKDMKAGLLDSSGQQLPLEAVNVKCKLQDLLSQVVIFQKYTNKGTEPIEAKYVFPLDDSAAVCGFEAFIDGKHVVGQMKVKEVARAEYKQAIERGHGAYLMDQDAPDVFTISVGNLPPGATVIIKVTFVSELVVKDECVFFALPGSVAPWQESAALNQTTQVTLRKDLITSDAAIREFTLDMAIEMPYDITRLHCVTHKIRMKKTDSKAVVSLGPDQDLGPEGFQLFIGLSAMHLPRMWVENHPDKDSQACMLVFYPDFDSDPKAEGDEVVLLLDTSESMRGESLVNARRLALHVIKTLHSRVRVNVVVFGTDHSQAFLAARPLAEAREEVERFIKLAPPSGGLTDLWRPLRLLNLLPPSRGSRNLLLLSDGHVQSGMMTLQELRENSHHSRFFTCGLSTTANRHMLRALAQAGGGAYEYFDTKTKHTWKQKVSSQVQRMSSPGCSSVSVKWQQFNPVAPSPVQAPKRLQSLFNNSHTLVFGFVPHCTQATLVADLSGQELNTMVSTSELQKTKGTFLHKLTARAVIRDYEDGSLDFAEPYRELEKSELKSYIIELSREFSILSQLTSFVAIEERDQDGSERGFTDVERLLAEEDVDILSYMRWETEDETSSDHGVHLYSGSEAGSTKTAMLSTYEEEEEIDVSEAISAPVFDDVVLKCQALDQDQDGSERGFTDVERLLPEEDVDVGSCMRWETEDETSSDHGVHLYSGSEAGSTKTAMLSTYEEEEEIDVSEAISAPVFDDVVLKCQALDQSLSSFPIKTAKKMKKKSRLSYEPTSPGFSVEPYPKLECGSTALPSPPEVGSRFPDSPPEVGSRFLDSPPLGSRLRSRLTFRQAGPESPASVRVEEPAVPLRRREGALVQHMSLSSFPIKTAKKMKKKSRPSEEPTSPGFSVEPYPKLECGSTVLPPPPEVGSRFPDSPPEVGSRFPDSPPEVGSRFPDSPPEVGSRFLDSPPLGSRLRSRLTFRQAGPESPASVRVEEPAVPLRRREGALVQHMKCRSRRRIEEEEPPEESLSPGLSLDKFLSSDVEPYPKLECGSTVLPPPPEVGSRFLETEQWMYKAFQQPGYVPLCLGSFLDDSRRMSGLHPPPPLPPPPPQSLPPQSLPPQSLPPQSLPPQSLPPQSLPQSLPPPPPQSLPPQSLPPQSLPPQSLPPQSLPPQSLPQSLPPPPPQSLPSQSLPPQSLPQSLPPPPPPQSLPPQSLPQSLPPPPRPSKAPEPSNPWMHKAVPQSGWVKPSTDSFLEKTWGMSRAPTALPSGPVKSMGVMFGDPEVQPMMQHSFGGFGFQTSRGDLGLETSTFGGMSRAPTALPSGPVKSMGVMFGDPEVQPMMQHSFGGFGFQTSRGDLGLETSTFGGMSRAPTALPSGPVKSMGVMFGDPEVQPMMQHSFGGFGFQTSRGDLGLETSTFGGMSRAPTALPSGPVKSMGVMFGDPEVQPMMQHSFGGFGFQTSRGDLGLETSTFGGMSRAPTAFTPHMLQAEDVEDVENIMTITNDCLDELNESDSVVSFGSSCTGEPQSGPDDPDLRWTEIFQLQRPEGFWELTPDLGTLITMNVSVLADDFLTSKGICSLGATAHLDILRLLATLLVLQLLRVKSVDLGRFLRSLFHLSESEEQHGSEHWDQLSRAVVWVRWADRQYPCICSRLELGLSWESTTRQLLGFDPVPPHSPLRGLDLRSPGKLFWEESPV